MSDTLVAMLERAAGYPRHGLRILDRREEATWLPWPELVERAATVAGALRASGVAAGDRARPGNPGGAGGLPDAGTASFRR